MRRIPIAVLAVALGIASSLGAITACDPATQQQSGTRSMYSTEPKSTGEVQKVDKSRGEITIKHGPIDNLSMPAMTMAFRVKDPAMLEHIKEGDKINFVVEKLNGEFTVTSAEPAR